VSDNSYPELVNLSNLYWKKYKNKNDINSYIKMFTQFDMSFFNQLDQLLPARADNLTGLVIQPTLLERSKDNILTAVSYENDTYEASLDAFANNNIDSSFLTIDSVVFANNLSFDDSYVDVMWDSSVPLIFNQYGIYPVDATVADPPYWTTDPIINITGSSRYPDLNEYTLFTSGGIDYRAYSVAQTNVYRPRGTWNHTYGGSRVTSPGFNIPSPDTTDGGPVVNIIQSNPTQLIYQGGTTNQGKFTVAKPVWNYALKLPQYRPTQAPQSYTKNLYD